MFSSYGGWGRPVNTTTIYKKRKVSHHCDLQTPSQQQQQQQQLQQFLLYNSKVLETESKTVYAYSGLQPFPRDSNGKDPGGHCG